MLERLRAIAKALVLNAIAPSWWWGTIRESFSGAWQKNVTVETRENLLTNSAIFACVTGIASDIAKMRVKLSRDEGGIWVEITTGSPWLPLLRKPNRYQNRIQFLIQWVISKLLAGNTYALKQRDGRGVVSALFILDPRRVIPLVAEDGSVYYELQVDHLSELIDSVTVPASEIIHDRMPTLWHPLVGVSPLYACALAGTLGNRILNTSTGFFENQAMPGGLLTAPGRITDETAARLKKDFEEKFTGANRGRLAVLGDGLKFEVMQMTAEAAQLAEQLKLSREEIATAFHYPLFKLGGPMPPYAGNVEALITAYYTDCLQVLVESIELCLDEGLELPSGQGTEFDLDNLMRMDTTTLVLANKEAVGAGIKSPNEARFSLNLKPTVGGETPYLQQQNYSLAALAKRDAMDDPFGKSAPAPASPPPPVAPPLKSEPSGSLDEEDQEMLFRAHLRELVSA